MGDQNLNASDPSNPWTIAAAHCWSHIETVTAVQRIIDALKDVPVDSVIPIISSMGPSIIVTPPSAGDESKVRAFAYHLRALVQSEEPVRPIEQGQHWCLRFRAGRVTVDVATQVPVTLRKEFAV